MERTRAHQLPPTLAFGWVIYLVAQRHMARPLQSEVRVNNYPKNAAGGKRYLSARIFHFGSPAPWEIVIFPPTAHIATSWMLYGYGAGLIPTLNLRRCVGSRPCSGTVFLTPFPITISHNCTFSETMGGFLHGRKRKNEPNLPIAEAPISVLVRPNSLILMCPYATFLSAHMALQSPPHLDSISNRPQNLPVFVGCATASISDGALSVSPPFPTFPRLWLYRHYDESRDARYLCS